MGIVGRDVMIMKLVADSQPGLERRKTRCGDLSFHSERARSLLGSEPRGLSELICGAGSSGLLEGMRAGVRRHRMGGCVREGWGQQLALRIKLAQLAGLGSQGREERLGEFNVPSNRVPPKSEHASIVFSPRVQQGHSQ